MFYQNIISKTDKITFSVIGLFCVAVLLLSACDLDKPSAKAKTEHQEVKPKFSVKNEKLGRATYETLLKTFRQANEEGVDLKDKKAIESMAYQNSLEELRAVNLISEDEFLEGQSAPKESVLMGGTADKAVSKLSPAAQKILAKVLQAVKASPTYATVVGYVASSFAFVSACKD